MVFCFYVVFSDSQKDFIASGKRGSNPLRAIKNHSHLLGGFLLFDCFFQIVRKTLTQLESRGSNPLRAIKYHSHLLGGFLLLFVFSDRQKDRKAALKRGSNPQRAIRNYSHVLGGFLLLSALVESHNHPLKFQIGSQKPIRMYEST